MDYSRQREIFEPATFNEAVHIIGCGATGSWVALTLAKMGVSNIHLWDFDTVEEHNLPNQVFGLCDIGKLKVDALERVILEATGLSVTKHAERVGGSTNLFGFVYLLTDTMSSRKEIFTGALRYNMKVKFLVETRMGLESYIIHTVNTSNKKDIEAFEGTLHDDEVATASMCGASQSLAPTAMLTASKAIWCMLNLLRGEPNPRRQLLDIGRNTLIEMEG